jgi:flagellin-like hook-associated protein FlgL
VTEYVHLIGAEDVRTAANTMSSAADSMRSAASSIDSTLGLFIRRFDEQVSRLEAASDRLATAIEAAQVKS